MVKSHSPKSQSVGSDLMALYSQLTDKHAQTPSLALLAILFLSGSTAVDHREGRKKRMSEGKSTKPLFFSTVPLKKKKKAHKKSLNSQIPILNKS